MAVEIACGNCGKAFGVQPDWAGLAVQCPFCEVAVQVPAEVTNFAADAEAGMSVSDSLDASQNAKPDLGFSIDTGKSKSVPTEVPSLEIVTHKNSPVKEPPSKESPSKEFQDTNASTQEPKGPKQSGTQVPKTQVPLQRTKLDSGKKQKAKAKIDTRWKTGASVPKPEPSPSVKAKTAETIESRKSLGKNKPDRADSERSMSEESEPKQELHSETAPPVRKSKKTKNEPVSGSTKRKKIVVEPKERKIIPSATAQVDQGSERSGNDAPATTDSSPPPEPSAHDGQREADSPTIKEVTDSESAPSSPLGDSFEAGAARAEYPVFRLHPLAFPPTIWHSENLAEQVDVVVRSGVKQIEFHGQKVLIRDDENARNIYQMAGFILSLIILIAALAWVTFR